MAPEQILTPQAIDKRIDIYSLGMVLYECLVGELPFPVADPLSWAGLAKEVPPVTKRVKCPAGVGEIVARMTAREAKNRYASMAEAEASLDAFADSAAESMMSAIEACRSARSTSRQATAFGEAAVGLPPQMPVEVSFSAPPEWSSTPAQVRTPTLVDAAPEAKPEPAVESATPTPAGQQEKPGTPESKSQQAEAFELRELRSANRLKQEAALNRLSETSRTPQLLFDFLTNACIWCGPGAVARSISMERPNLILGRNASQVDLPFEDPTISRQHVVFHITTSADGKKTVYAEDLSSASGTTVNRVSLDFESLGMKKLSDGDLLRVGSRDIAIHVLAMDRTIIQEDRVADEKGGDAANRVRSRPLRRKSYVAKCNGGSLVAALRRDDSV